MWKTSNKESVQYKRVKYRQNLQKRGKGVDVRSAHIDVLREGEYYLWRTEGEKYVFGPFHWYKTGHPYHSDEVSSLGLGL
jgi:hypothetical protein